MAGLSDGLRLSPFPQFITCPQQNGENMSRMTTTPEVEIEPANLRWQEFVDASNSAGVFCDFNEGGTAAFGLNSYPDRQTGPPPLIQEIAEAFCHADWVLPDLLDEHERLFGARLHMLLDRLYEMLMWMEVNGVATAAAVNIRHKVASSFDSNRNIKDQTAFAELGEDLRRLSKMLSLEPTRGVRKTSRQSMTMPEKLIDFLMSRKNTEALRYDVIEYLWPDDADNSDCENRLKQHIGNANKLIFENPTLPRIIISQEDGFVKAISS